MDSYVKASELKEKRDKKTIPHLEQYAPVWIVEETLMLEEDAIQFHVVFNHLNHGWVNRRYRYDGFNNTLYHKGQTVLDEDEALEITLKDPYISATVADIPNSYGG
jgi:hypothetical protein